jgi:transaldolase
MPLKIFYDGATVEEILTLCNDPNISGFTTNPALIKKAGIKDYEKFCKDMLGYISEKPVSFEVISDDFDEMYRQAKIISSWGENVLVKIPIRNTIGIKSNQLIKQLATEHVKVNVTAILTTEEIDDAIDSLKNSYSIISIFAGRIADCGYDPTWYINYGVMRKKSKQQILWASCREVYNIVQAQKCGADIITVPNDILKKTSLIGRDLDQMSLDTIRMFYNDAVQSGYSL